MDKTKLKEILKKEMEAFKPRGFANIIYGDIPTFMDFTRAYNQAELKEANVVFMGFPFEGIRMASPTIFYPPNGPDAGPDSIGFRTGSDRAPESVRKWSILHSMEHISRGWMLDYDITLTDYLNVVDYGDAACVKGDVVNSHAAARQKVREIVEAGAIPLIQGGDHSVAIPGILGITDCVDERMGIIGFDCHFDLDYAPLLQDEGRDWERLGPASQYIRALETGLVEPENIVLIGLRGYRNPKAWANIAKSLGIRYFTMKEIDEIGIEKVIEEAIERTNSGTKHLYVTLDVDSIDFACCAGQKYPDTPGLTPREVIKALRLIGSKRVISGFDIACLSPQYDPWGATSLLAARCFLEVLSSLAVQFKKHNIRNWYQSKAS